MAPRRGRPRRHPYVLCTHHGHPALRIYLPDGGDTRQRIPAGWDAPTTFAAWLHDYAAAHVGVALPEEWSLYVGAAGLARLPTRTPADAGTRAARSHVARSLREVSAPTAKAPPPPREVMAWTPALEGYLQALRHGWHPPGPSSRSRRPDSIPAVRRHLYRIARLMGWATVDDLAPEKIHAWTQTEEQRRNELNGELVKHNSICTWRSYLRAFAIWCHQVGHLPADLTLAWPRYSRTYQPRQARCTVGDLDQAIALAPATFRKGAPCRVVLVLMRWTGLRRKGIARLSRGAFRLEADPPHIVIDPSTDKTSRGRLVPLNAPCVAELRDWFARRDYAPGDLPFGRRRPDGSVYTLGDAASWTRLGDRLGLPRNLDGTGGMHRARKAAMSAMLDRPTAAADGPAASWRRALDLTGVSPLTLDTYYRRSTITELDAAKLMPAPKHGRPLQLAFAFSPAGEIHAEVRHEDGHISRAPLPDRGESRRRVLALVADITAIASDGTAEKAGAPPPDRVGMAAWRRSASASFRRPRRSTVAGRAKP